MLIKKNKKIKNKKNHTHTHTTYYPGRAYRLSRFIPYTYHENFLLLSLKIFHYLSERVVECVVALHKYLKCEANISKHTRSSYIKENGTSMNMIIRYDYFALCKHLAVAC